MKWQKWISRQGVDITSTEQVDQAFFRLIYEYTRSCKENYFTVAENKVFTHYTKVDLDKVGRYLYKKHWFKPEQVKKYYQQSLRDKKQNELAARNWRRKLEKNLSKKSLIRALEVFSLNFKKFNFKYSIAPFLPIEAWQKDFEITVRPLLIGKSPDERKLILEALTNPWKKTYIASLKEKVGQLQPERILEQSQFLRSWSIIWYEPLTIDWAKGLMSKKIAATDRKNLLNTKKLIKKLKPDQNQIKFIEIAPYLAFYKDWRDELRRRQVYVWSFLFDKIAEFLDLEREQLGYLTLAEIKRSINLGKIYGPLIEWRKKNLIVVTSRPNSLKPLVIDKNIGKYLKIIRKTESKKGSKTIKGLVAFPGRVVGRAKIVNGAEDLIKFKQGEVLVANTTHPNYLPAMQESIAIVTNEGGLMCHAAITAREMKISCIVGTKIATRVLKDGMMVEVDADQGIVRIIK